MSRNVVRTGLTLVALTILIGCEQTRTKFSEASAQVAVPQDLADTQVKEPGPVSVHLISLPTSSRPTAIVVVRNEGPVPIGIFTGGDHLILTIDRTSAKEREFVVKTSRKTEKGFCILPTRSEIKLSVPLRDPFTSDSEAESIIQAHLVGMCEDRLSAEDKAYVIPRLRNAHAVLWSVPVVCSEEKHWTLN